MNVLVAGATGAIGRPLISALLSARHNVFGMTSSTLGLQTLKEDGAEGLLANALDAQAVDAAIKRARPEVVIDELTSLPKHYTPDEMRAAAERDHKLRLEGGQNVLNAARAAGARRYIIQSTGFYYAPGPGLAHETDPFDFILEGTGFSPLVFEAMDVLAKDGVLAMVSITGGERKVEIPADRINQGFVLGNKVALGSVNASREDFERAVLDLSAAELSFPGWLAKLLTHRVKGLENYGELIEKLTTAKGAIKVFCEVNGDGH